MPSPLPDGTPSNRRRNGERALRTSPSEATVSPVEDAVPDGPPTTRDYVQCLSCFALVEVADAAGSCPVCGGSVAEEAATEPEPAAPPVSRKDLLAGLLRAGVRGRG